MSDNERDVLNERKRDVDVADNATEDVTDVAKPTGDIPKDVAVMSLTGDDMMSVDDTSEKDAGSDGMASDAVTDEKMTPTDDNMSEVDATSTIDDVVIIDSNDVDVTVTGGDVTDGDANEQPSGSIEEAMAKEGDVTSKSDADDGNADYSGIDDSHDATRTAIRWQFGVVFAMMVFCFVLVAVMGGTIGSHGGSAGDGTQTNGDGTSGVVIANGACDDSETPSGQVVSGCDSNVTVDGAHGYDMLTTEQARMLTGRATKDVINGINDSKTFVTLFGFAACPDCKAGVPVLLDVALGAGYDEPIWYVDTRAKPEWHSNIDIDDYDELCDLIGDDFPIDDDGKPHLEAPTVVFVRDGKVTLMVQGDYGLSKTEEGSTERENLKSELADQYANGFMSIKD